MSAITKEIRGAILTSGGDIGTGNNGNTIVGLQGVPIATTPPSDGEVLTYDGAHSEWKPEPPVGQQGVVGITIDGGGVSPLTGSKGFIRLPYSGTITSWTLIADTMGSCQITVKSGVWSGFPTDASIVAAAPPNLSAQQNNSSSTLTGWTTTLAAGDFLEFVLNSVVTLTRVILELQVLRSS